MKNKTTWRHGDTRERLRDEHPSAGEQAGEARRRDRRLVGRREAARIGYTVRYAAGRNPGQVDEAAVRDQPSLDHARHHVHVDVASKSGQGVCTTESAMRAVWTSARVSPSPLTAAACSVRAPGFGAGIAPAILPPCAPESSSRPRTTAPPRL